MNVYCIMLISLWCIWNVAVIWASIGQWDEVTNLICPSPKRLHRHGLNWVCAYIQAIILYMLTPAATVCKLIIWLYAFMRNKKEK